MRESRRSGERRNAAGHGQASGSVGAAPHRGGSRVGAPRGGDGAQRLAAPWLAGEAAVSHRRLRHAGGNPDLPAVDRELPDELAQRSADGGLRLDACRRRRARPQRAPGLAQRAPAHGARARRRHPARRRAAPRPAARHRAHDRFALRPRECPADDARPGALLARLARSATPSPSSSRPTTAPSASSGCLDRASTT